MIDSSASRKKIEMIRAFWSSWGKLQRELIRSYRFTRVLLLLFIHFATIINHTVFMYSYCFLLLPQRRCSHWFCHWVALAEKHLDWKGLFWCLSFTSSKLISCCIQTSAYACKTSLRCFSNIVKNEIDKERLSNPHNINLSMYLNADKPLVQR